MCLNNSIDGSQCVRCHLDKGVHHQPSHYIPIKHDNFDEISSPSHYIEGRKYEPRKVITDWGLNFNLGNAVKYISRAGRKNDKIEDLQKAIQYIKFEIEDTMEQNNNHKE